MSGLRSSELSRIRELVADKVREQPGVPEATVLAPRRRARQGNPEVVQWCPSCKERALPMRNGTCGFCGTRLRKIPARKNVGGSEAA